ncbi:putative non-specific lipid-transfer protein AKCS9 [Drosera capensis]
MNKNTVSLVLLVLVAAAVVLDSAPKAEACSVKDALKLLPCRDGPSRSCCSEMKQQKSCLCSYYRNPELKHYFPSNSKEIAAKCGVKVYQYGSLEYL